MIRMTSPASASTSTTTSWINVRTTRFFKRASACGSCHTASRSAARCSNASRGGAGFPLFRITEDGTPESVGELLTLAAHQTVWMPEGAVSEGLPTELADARPSGFLGRHFAASHPDLRL